MNRQTLKLAVLTILFGLAVGMLAPHLLRGERQREEEPTITLPEGELKTDAFSLHLLQTSMQTPPYNISIVCPAAMTEALHELDSMSKGATHQQIAALKLCPPGKESPTSTVLSAMDDTMPHPADGRSIILLPFRNNYPEAISDFNTLIGYRAAESVNTSKETRLFMAARTMLNCRFRQPFYRQDSVRRDFDNANGGMPSVSMLRRCGHFRLAEAEDGSWKAVALLMDDAFGGDAASCAFVAVIPQGKLREFTLQLDAAQLSAIRRALAQAKPQECTVEMPKLNLSFHVSDSAPFLQALGVSAPFDENTADFSPLTTGKLTLSAMTQSLSFSIIEEPGRPSDIPAPGSCPKTFSLTRPFLWFIGDLTTDVPFVVMGIVENL